MTAPYDIDPKNENWTQDEMKLRYRGAWSTDYSAALAANTGFNRWFHSRLASEFAIGSNPDPLTDGPNVSSGVIQIHQGFDSTTPDLVDDSIDWRDRRLMYVGYVAMDVPSALSGFVVPGVQLFGATYFNANTGDVEFIDQATRNYTGHCIADGYTGPGNDAVASAPIRGVLIQVDTVGSGHQIYLGAKTNGDLLGRLGSAETYGSVAVGWIFYTEQLGHRDD
jgi:hypothetical protein